MGPLGLLLMGALLLADQPEQQTESHTLTRPDPIQEVEILLAQSGQGDAASEILRLLQEIRENQKRDRDEFDARLKTLESRPVPELSRPAEQPPEQVARSAPSGKARSGWRIDLYTNWQAPRDSRPVGLRLMEPVEPIVKTTYRKNTEFDALTGADDDVGDYVRVYTSNFVPRKTGTYLIGVRINCGSSVFTNGCDLKFQLAGQDLFRVADGNAEGEIHFGTYEATDLDPIAMRFVIGPNGRGMSWDPRIFRHHPLVKGPGDDAFRNYTDDELIYFSSE